MRDPRDQFGPAAESYLSSFVHSNPRALSHMVDVVRPSGGTVVDVATGAGHTAYVFAPFVDRVIATDITPDMLRVTRQAAKDRALDNVEVLFASAESLPFRDKSLDGVTCRLGAHHFTNVHSFVRDTGRALKEGGWLLLVDTIGSEEDETDEKVDHFERTRDPSHVRNYRRSDWLKLITSSGLSVHREEVTKKEIDAEDWMERMNVSDSDRSYLREMIESASGGFADYLSTFTKEGRLTIHLDEILIYARNTG